MDYIIIGVILQIFDDQPVEDWIVTPKNLKRIVSTLNAQNFTEMKVEAYNYLSRQENGQAKVTEFLQSMHVLIMKLPQRDLAQNFQTQAHQLQVMLKELQMNYLSKDRESQGMFKKLQHAINVLNNKRQLFAIDPAGSLMADDINDEEEKKDTTVLFS